MQIIVISNSKIVILTNVTGMSYLCLGFVTIWAVFVN